MLPGLRLSVRTKLLATFLALVAVVGAVALIALERSLSRDLMRSLDDRLVAQARGVAQWVETGTHPERLAPRLAAVVDARVTILTNDGAIEGDSARDEARAEAEEGEAEPAPPGAPEELTAEVAAARIGEIGRATRIEHGIATHYVAVAAGPDRVVRLAVPLSDVAATRSALLDRLLAVSAAGFLLALVLGLLAVRAVVRPLQRMTRDAERLARGDFAVAPPSRAQDELGILSRTLSALATEVQARIGDLTRERDLLSSVLGALVEGVVVLAGDGAVLLVNAAAADLVGEDRGGLAQPELRRVIESALVGASAPEVEVTLRGRAVLASARPLRGAGRGAVVVLYDVTRLRRLEVVRREFLASATHELRTPVTSIQGYAETLLGAAVDEPTRREFVEVIHRNAQRIGRLVDDLLLLEQIEARPQPLHARQTVDVAEVIGDVARTVGAAAERSGVVLAVEAQGPLLALGDREGIEQAVQNLVDNAIKYGASGGVVRVQAAPVGRRVRIAVSDDGPGIAAEHVDQIFERFYRIDPGRSRASGGNGLGLAIVKQRVEAMGGTVTADGGTAIAAPGKGRGATFTVELDAPRRGETES